jgi:hypothetical protein
VAEKLREKNLKKNLQALDQKKQIEGQRSMKTKNLPSFRDGNDSSFAEKKIG